LFPLSVGFPFRLHLPWPPVSGATSWLTGVRPRLYRERHPLFPLSISSPKNRACSRRRPCGPLFPKLRDQPVSFFFRQRYLRRNDCGRGIPIQVPMRFIRRSIWTSSGARHHHHTRSQSFSPTCLVKKWNVGKKNIHSIWRCFAASRLPVLTKLADEEFLRARAASPAPGKNHRAKVRFDSNCPFASKNAIAKFLTNSGEPRFGSWCV